ncbi:MAG: UDP-N-acetylglucosamine 2-epimerase [Candidatus Hadarchaeaceae archaeon]
MSKRPKISEPNKVLFVPINDNHVRIFGSLRELKGMKVLAIGLDKYKHEQAEETLRELGIPFKPIQRYGVEKAQHIIEVEKPDIAVVGNDIDAITSSFVKTANSAGIPSLLVQDGAISRRAFERLINPSYIRRIVSRLIRGGGRGYVIKRGIQRAARRAAGMPETTAYGSGECKKIAVWGIFTKGMFVGEGMDPEKVIITGNPRLDVVCKGKFNKDEFYRKLKLSKDKKIVALATSGLVEAGLWTDNDMRILVRAVSDAVERFPNLQLVIKPHPRESIKEFKRYLPPKSANTIVAKNIALYDLINVCELLMTEVSTAALEAVAFGKPVLILNFTDKPYPSTPYPEAYIKGGVALEVRKVKDLVRKMGGALYEPKVRKRFAKNRQRFVREHLFKLDGQSSKRVVGLIKQMIKSGGGQV